MDDEVIEDAIETVEAEDGSWMFDLDKDDLNNEDY